MNDWVQIISSVGFPIFMCLVIMYYWNNQFTEIIKQLSDSVSQLKTVVGDNTKMIEMLKDRLEDMQ